MQKLECGICRITFKKEYFGNDPIVNNIFNNNHSNVNRHIRRNYINNNENINNNNINSNINVIRISNNHHINPIIQSQIYNHNYYYNNNNNPIIIRYVNTNRNILERSESNISESDTICCSLFFISFEPSKCFCLLIMFVNIFLCGLGTFLMGLGRKKTFYTLLGLMQCVCFFYLYSFEFSNEKNKIFGKDKHIFFSIYFRILISIFYATSVYFSFFRNFIFCNTRKINFNEKKEKGIFVFILNILICGLGTILMAIINLYKEERTFCQKVKTLLFGIIQLIGYILLLLAITLITQKDSSKIDVAILFIIGILSYVFSMYTSYKYYKELISIS